MITPRAVGAVICMGTEIQASLTLNVVLQTLFNNLREVSVGLNWKRTNTTIQVCAAKRHFGQRRIAYTTVVP